MDAELILKQFVDCLMPELTPHEASMYMFLLRNSWFANSAGQVRIGQRTIAQKYGRGPKMAVPSRAHILRQIEELQQKGCIRIFDTTREGTLYEIMLPESIPLVREKLISACANEKITEDYYHDPSKRLLVFERDKWHCQYCGERVSEKNATLDHYVPQCEGGDHHLDNLKTACLMCNSIKSGKTYQEAAISLLESIQNRKLNEIKEA